MSAVGQTVESVEKASDGLYKLLIGGLAAGAVGAVAYGLWKCYQKKGKLDASTMTQCLIEDLAYLGLKMGEGTAKEAWEVAKTGAKEAIKTWKDNPSPLNPGGGNTPISKWMDGADDTIKKGIKKGAVEMYEGTKKLGGKIAHVFKDPKEGVKPFESVVNVGEKAGKGVETAAKAVGHETSKIAHKIGSIFHF